MLHALKTRVMEDRLQSAELRENSTSIENGIQTAYRLQIQANYITDYRELMEKHKHYREIREAIFKEYLGCDFQRIFRMRFSKNIQNAIFKEYSGCNFQEY